jgi:spermidine/putrescine ABC transporter ATP-binding subunit
MRVSIQHLTKNFGDSVVLKGISIEVRDQELYFLLGPSGCGKTTLLRLIAGFYQPDAGQLFFGDKPMNDVPAHRRNTGMVFQNYALWPHMTVAENVAYGLEVRAVSQTERKERVAEALSIVQMEKYAGRAPNQLSGGQQQRIALARALVVKPDVLLLDEPLSNLDARLRLEMREEIRRIHAQTKITTIYVTHDQKESLSLADRIAVMRDGLIEQIGDPRTIYRAPGNRFVADFIGETNWLKGEVLGRNSPEIVVRTAFGNFHAEADAKPADGQKVWLGFRPEAVEIGDNKINALDTTISHISYLGEVEQYELRLSPEVTIKAFEQNPLEIRPPGGPLRIHVRPGNLIVLPAE